ncbi:hydrogenase iron-sulfur subunit [Sulfurisoma sediminicola]|uniref:Putative adenylylsulfate reductase-associated electron transfer protein QmoB n=1 Tax=Sulfurisoma sediminicola TaxID=1381557 RepID=A0A497XBE0_9PROT|nr:hydrogenase iron-sulfur subunit [Sulfurisoma sediminicola]RLJ63640.1 putative adenylylsulfate reductase-associated electron transfer protein QmoB [Sulfurisoma sediminicola]
MADIKYAAYICSGCGIGDKMNVAGLEKVAKTEGKMAVIKNHPFLCNAEGVQMIRDDIANDGVTHLCIAACSRRSKAEAFSFPTVAVSRANLREGVLWVVAEGADHDEVRQEMAEDYVRMGCAEVKKMKLPEGNPNKGDAQNKRIMVVGGGMSGMTAALAAAEAGYEAVLVEKTGALGGFASKLWKRVPFSSPYAEPQATGVEEMVAKVTGNAKIKVHLNTTVAETGGAPGRFTVKLAQESGAVSDETVGAIVQASGFTPYDMAKLPELGGGQANVVDQAGLEALAKTANGGAIKRADGKEVKSVVFVQCAGQRDETGTHLSYCSGHCCATSIKQAMYFKDANPDVDTVVMYTDLRVPGMGEDFYRSAQQKGVIFTKGKASKVSGGDSCKVDFTDLILDEQTSIDADLVVLATGQVANAGVNLDAWTEVNTAAEGGNEEAKVQRTEMKTISVLNLNYRQGPDVPQFKHGFADSHFICFPYETRRTGIYAAGPTRRPMDMLQATEDATGAALKAIQAVENASQGRAAHPRAWDLSFPSARLEGCTQCKRCTVECPFGAIDEDEKRFPVFNEQRCRRCGTCMGACPVRVISFENYSCDTVGMQIKAVNVPDEDEEKPRILVLACENDAYPALDMAGVQRLTYSAYVRAIPVRCLGSVNTIWITDALNGGYDGVMMMGCKKGDDYQCHFVKGSEMASYRMSKIGDTLKQMGIESERVVTHEVAITDNARVAKLIDDYVAELDKLGPSPMKGFG